MKSAMEEKKKMSFSGPSQQVSIPSTSSISNRTDSESVTENPTSESEGGAVGGSNGSASQATSTPPSGNGGAGNPNAVTATVGDKKVDPTSATAPTPSVQPSGSGPGMNQGTIGPNSKSDTYSAADVDFGQDVVNGTSKIPNPSTPDTGAEVDVPSTTTPTPATPSYDDNRAPMVRAMHMDNNRVRWDDVVDIDINGSDPKLGPPLLEIGMEVQMDFHMKRKSDFPMLTNQQSTTGFKLLFL